MQEPVQLPEIEVADAALPPGDTTIRYLSSGDPPYACSIDLDSYSLIPLFECA